MGFVQSFMLWFFLPFLFAISRFIFLCLLFRFAEIFNHTSQYVLKRMYSVTIRRIVQHQFRMERKYAKKKMLLCNKVTKPILTEFGIWLVPLFMAQSSAHVLCSQQQWFCFTENHALGHSSAFRLSIFVLMKTAMKAAVHTTFDKCLQFYTLYVCGKMRGTRSEYVINEWDCTNRNFDFQHWYTHTNISWDPVHHFKYDFK